MAAGGDINNVWEKFGCNDFNVAIFAHNYNQTASQLINGYVSSSEEPKFPLVDKDNGGPEIREVFNVLFPDGFGMGRTAFIRTDKSFKRIYYSPESSFTNYLTDEGCELNSCDITDIVSDKKAIPIKSNTVRIISPEACAVSVATAGAYTINVYSVAGRQIVSVKQQLTAGVNNVSLKQNKGIAIFVVKGYKSVFISKQILK